jgi:hypothetical protein
MPNMDQKEINQMKSDKRRERQKVMHKPDQSLDGSFEVSEIDEEADDAVIRDTKSNSSFKMEEVEGIMFGGFSSRFWLHRKSILSMTTKELQKLPFYSWECLTIFLKEREIDLVIKREKEMEMFLRLLIFKLKTADG